MKSFKNGLVIAVFLASVFGCDKPELVGTTTLQEHFLEKNSISYWHNEVLKVYYPDGRQIEKKAIIDHQNIRQEVIQILNQKDPSRFIKKEMEVNAIEFDQRIAKIGISMNTPTEFNKQSFKVVEYLKVEGYISPKLYTALLGIYLSERTNEALEKVNSIYLTTWSAQDRYYAETFANVYKASYIFWTTRKSNDILLRSASDCNNAIILADAAGALYGLLCGPVCSIVESALFSLIAANGPACAQK